MFTVEFLPSALIRELSSLAKARHAALREGP